MLVPFETLPRTSRIWVYQSNLELTESQQKVIESKLEQFVNTWQRHGEDLKGSFKIMYNHFIVLAVDESFNDVSGCSIDASVRAIQDIEQELSIDLMNKMNLAFKVGENINIVDMNTFRGFISADKISQETVVFNNMVQSLADFQDKWEVPATESWHNRFFN